MKIIIMPRLLTVGWSNKLLTLCREAMDHTGPVTFDFKNVTWAAPFGLTAISVILEKCVKNKQVFYSAPRDTKVREYLERIGFDKAFLEKGKNPRHVPSSVELRRLNAVDPGCTEALIALLETTTKLSGDEKFQMNLHINELMTNGFDHSKGTYCYVCAQWYQKNNNLRISFSDGGIGILKSLTLAGYTFHDDSEAINAAVEPGITSRAGRVGGMGLTYIRDYVKRNEGVLTIISGFSKVNFYYNKIEPKLLPQPFVGTIVDIRIKTGQKLRYSKAVAERPIFT